MPAWWRLLPRLGLVNIIFGEHRYRVYHRTVAESCAPSDPSLGASMNMGRWRRKRKAKRIRQFLSRSGLADGVAA